jgi:hypothetical protein
MDEQTKSEIKKLILTKDEVRQLMLEAFEDVLGRTALYYKVNKVANTPATASIPEEKPAPKKPVKVVVPKFPRQSTAPTEKLVELMKPVGVEEALVYLGVKATAKNKKRIFSSYEYLVKKKNIAVKIPKLGLFYLKD